MRTSISSGEPSEARHVLTGLARGRFGRIAPERIAEHVLTIVSSPDWPIRRAALDALARRYSFGQRDQLRVSERPRRELLGIYRTKSADGKRTASSYDTALLALSPLRTSCGCADFVRSSLGLCKHGLVVLETLEKNGALKQLSATGPSAQSSGPTLQWLAEHPLQGEADRLARLRFVSARKAARAPDGMRDGKPLTRQLRSPEQRLALIRACERMLRRGSLDAEPAVVRLLSEEGARAERLAVNESGSSAALSSLRSLSRKLYPYQREGVKRFLESGRLLLADDMGLGKTTQAIAACHALFETRRVKRGLLIVPASLKSQWHREWSATTRVPLTSVEGSPAERARCYGDAPRGMLIIGYEQLLRDFHQVQRYAPEIVVLDEAQRIKNWATKSAAYVKALAPAYRLVLTGTPMENRLDELASIMDFVDDVALEPKWRLTPFHTLSQSEAGRSVQGAQHLDVLRQRLSGSMLRRVRKDVLSQLPARVDTRVPVEMTSAQRAQHEDLRRPIAELISKSERRPLLQAEFLRLMQLLTTQRMICNGLAQLNFAAEWPRCEHAQPTPELLESLFAPKLAVLRGLVEQVVLGQQRKTLVFSQWRGMLRLGAWAVSDLLAASGQRALFFTGAESLKQRERAIIDFHDDPAVSMLFLSDAGGVGLNLQRAASCCINLELPWNPAVLEQRIGRIYRLGQTAPIDVYNLVCDEGIEARIAGVIARKQALFSTLFDGTTNAVLFDGQSSFMEGVKRLLDPSPLPVAPVDDSVGDAPAAAPLPELAAEPPIIDAVAPEPARSGISVVRLPDGGLRLEAPPALAAPLAELFEQLASSLRSQDANRAPALTQG
jgi:superfamily II DNA or RNA helicase